MTERERRRQIEAAEHYIRVREMRVRKGLDVPENRAALVRLQERLRELQQAAQVAPTGERGGGET